MLGGGVGVHDAELRVEHDDRGAEEIQAGECGVAHATLPEGSHEGVRPWPKADERSLPAVGREARLTAGPRALS
jgi:hypothetical protein